MHANRLLALFGALSILVAALPAYAQYYGYGYRSRYGNSRSLRSQIRANRFFGAAVNPRPDLLGRIDNAYGRGLISAQEADSLTKQYYDSIAQDQREGTGAYMANYDYVLNNLINLRTTSLGR